MNLHRLSACIAALFAFATPATATSFNIQPFSKFVQDAPHIVRGNLHDIVVEHGITADGNQTIYTYATLDIREPVKGSFPRATIRVRKLGGTKDGVTLEVPSSPVFVENQDTVLFLSEAREDESYDVWGMELGKFETREQNGETFLQGGILEYTAEHIGKTPRPDRPEIEENNRSWTLSQLKQLVARDANGTKSAPPSPSPAQSAAAGTMPETSNESKPAHGDTHDDEPTAESDESDPGPGPGAYVLVGALALAIFLYFKRRG